jgi:hypothetical protein
VTSFETNVETSKAIRSPLPVKVRTRPLTWALSWHPAGMDQSGNRSGPLAGRHEIVLDDEAFAALLRILDRPARRIPSLVELFERPSPFGS